MSRPTIHGSSFERNPDVLGFSCQAPRACDSVGKVEAGSQQVAAAAASSLQDQAGSLSQAVGAFRLAPAGARYLTAMTSSFVLAADIRT